MYLHRSRFLRRSKKGYYSVAIPPVYVEILKLDPNDTIDLELDLQKNAIQLKKADEKIRTL